jgi:hypothetical protein
MGTDVSHCLRVTGLQAVHGHGVARADQALPRGVVVPGVVVPAGAPRCMARCQ